MSDRKFIANLMIEKNDSLGIREVIRDADILVDQRVGAVVLRHSTPGQTLIPLGWDLIAITLMERPAMPVEELDKSKESKS